MLWMATEFDFGRGMQCRSPMTTQADFKWICALIAELPASPTPLQILSSGAETQPTRLY